MPTAVWSSTPADGDWDNTSNWSGGGGVGGVPANGDTVIINASSQNITTNLTTGLTSITLKIGPGYTGDIGSSTTWLDLDGTLDFESGGSNCYITGTYTTVTVHGGLASANMLNFRANASTDIGTLRCLGGSGTVTVGGNAVLDDVEMYDVPHLKVIVEDNVTSLDNVTIDSGVLECSGAVAAIFESRGGQSTIKDSATVVTLNIEPKGLVIYNSSGTITTLTVYGRFDGRKNTNASVTVTNCTTYESGHMMLSNGLNNWTFSNPITYNGGIIEWPPGVSLSI